MLPAPSRRPRAFLRPGPYAESADALAERPQRMHPRLKPSFANAHASSSLFLRSPPPPSLRGYASDDGAFLPSHSARYLRGQKKSVPGMSEPGKAELLLEFQAWPLLSQCQYVDRARTAGSVLHAMKRKSYRSCSWQPQAFICYKQAALRWSESALHPFRIPHSLIGITGMPGHFRGGSSNVHHVTIESL